MNLKNNKSLTKLLSTMLVTSTVFIAGGERAVAAETINNTVMQNNAEDAKYNIYYGGLHAHTSNSACGDQTGSVDDAYKYARDTSKLDFLALTDHSQDFDNSEKGTLTDGSASSEWTNGLASADKYTNNSFVAMYAYEMTWSNGNGHMNTYNTTGFESRNASQYKNYGGTSEGVKNYYTKLKTQQQSIAQINHPKKGDFGNFNYYDEEIDKILTLIEVGNGEGKIRGKGIASDNAGAYVRQDEYYSKALDKGWHLAPTNNQDTHGKKWGDSNPARTVILAKSLTRDNIYDAMKNRRVYATEDSNIQINYTLNGKIMGSIINKKPTTAEIVVDFNDPDGEEINTVKVFADGGKEIASKTVGASKGQVKFSLPATYSYYFIKVLEKDEDLAVTSAVWINQKSLPSKEDQKIMFKNNGPITSEIGSDKFSNTATGGDGNGSIKYSSSNTEVAKVDQNTGEVTILKVGNTTISAIKAEDDNYNSTKASYELNVIETVKEKDADYTEINNEKAKIPKDLLLYTKDSTKKLNDVLNCIDYKKTITEQKLVDSWASDLREAIKNLILIEQPKKAADYTAMKDVNNQIPTDLSIYTEASVNNLNDVLKSIDYEKTIEEQKLVDSWTGDLEEAIRNLILIEQPKKAADYTAIKNVKTKIPTDLSIYTEASVNNLNDKLESIDYEKTVEEQKLVDSWASDLEEAIKNLILIEQPKKAADYTAIKNVKTKIPTDLSIYTEASVNNLNDILKSIDYEKTIEEQKLVDSWASDLEQAINKLELLEQTKVSTDNEEVQKNQSEQAAQTTEKLPTGDKTSIIKLIALLIVSIGGARVSLKNKKIYK